MMAGLHLGLEPTWSKNLCCHEGSDLTMDVLKLLPTVGCGLSYVPLLVGPESVRCIDSEGIHFYTLNKAVVAAVVLILH